MSDLLRIAIVGFGEIACRQHVPAIAKTSGAALVAVADPAKAPSGLPHFRDLQELLRDGPEIDAVALCTPPQARHAQAAAALAAGKHVLLEKPPGATLSELTPLIAAAAEAGRTLFATWHSRYAPAVGPARQLLTGRTINKVTIIWKEDVRVWHPGQAWIFEAGGFGVFDPGINALSILTEILPCPVFVRSAMLDVPSNREAPIAAAIELSDENGLPIHAEFDFRQTGPPSWAILCETEAGPVMLSKGGRQLRDGNRLVVDATDEEYPALYRRFVALTSDGKSDVDLAPLRLVADSFMLGRRRLVEAFGD
ncbi:MULTISPECIES: Gfo/Idh/MocA family protein [unclassified Bradyrhizobium]|uniref:Gfo/Idh/MocA family protein n=1 Tax=unclassified Bradyrhizobium TaxID=2631580 RepID=UPI001BA90707|nr:MULTISPECIES: Gfo/Idh/MocA family oxidoreductase [unclassified Bradyrhizobium]MBR1202792.1 Gfo/Idh/MocA family oxidoreductase [Bradyrhizobium sp. AUGA SZCCT0124]MBR1314206.1 Gfo/Idh/MocA family oxidoreductase [Bradyrhizobium sp. AUGA SZCCT0051]MBR1342776.1 Gfo/Idh/MocA family oxidoreductase [Bradyrhizobium sp. AUGA SZCCT0105]MBR1353005.1 Gfo/Idh/MocA family oxidoreductase [Bradyrhizobium sp. AUGA SZCCT0045]